MKGTIAALMILLTISCAAQSQATTEPTYLESAMKWPTYFGVSSGEFTDVWQRARTWAEQFGNGKFTVLTDDEITTIKAPVEGDGSRTLRVTNSQTFGGYRIAVEVIPARADEKGEAAEIAHLLAYYLATGKAIPADLVRH